MGTRKKKRPEFELPPVLIAAIQDYLGPTEVNRLSPEQATALMELATSTAGQVGVILAGYQGDS